MTMMLAGIFQKRKKIQELRSPSLQDIKKLRDLYAKNAEALHVETPSCFEKSIYKAISCQKELHTVDFRQEDITDPQLIALAETLVVMPMISSLDLRDNRITDDGAKALLEVLRLQIIAAKTPVKLDPRTRKPIFPQGPEYKRYITQVNIKGNEISVAVLQELAQYTDLLKREDKRLEIRAALNHIDRNSDGGIDEEEFRAVLKLLTGTDPSKKEIKALMSQYTTSCESVQNATSLENLLLAKCSSSPSKKAACPPWESLVQVRHATLGQLGSGGHAQTPHLQALYQQKLHLSQSATSAAPSKTDSPSISPATTMAMASTQRFQIGAINQAAFSLPPPRYVNAAMLSPPPIQTNLSPVSAASLSPSEAAWTQAKLRTESRLPPMTPPPPAPVVLQSTSNGEWRGLTVTAPTPLTTSAPGKPSASTLSPQSSSSVLSPTKSPVERSTSVASLSTSSSAAAASPERKSTTEKMDEAVAASPSNSKILSLSSPIFDAASNDDVVFTDDEASNESSEHGGDGAGADEANDATSEQNQRTMSSFRSSTTQQQWQNSIECETLPSSMALLSDDDGRPKIKPSDLLSLAVPNNNSTRVTTLARNPDASSADPSELADPDSGDGAEHVDSTVLEIKRDDKPRMIAKFVHTEFKRGMLLVDFPGEVPTRNLVVLVLSHNRLTSLDLWTECRFPVLQVLDISSNRLQKIGETDFDPFPRLHVLNLGQNDLKQIHGLTKLFDLKALNISHNAVRIVKNLEHLVHLQVLDLSNNLIAGSPAVRSLSLNKMLQHLNLDGNPLFETDERQRRRNTVQIVNMVPTLISLGSVPCVSLSAKDRKKPTSDKKNDDEPRKTLPDGIENAAQLWISKACEKLEYFQDVATRGNLSPMDDDMDYSFNQSSSSSAKKPLTRGAQKQKDEMRSRALAFRSRQKAIPSPVKTKQSKYAFGPPLPPPPKSVKKKKVPVEPGFVQHQKRRASELSAPKHPPVDKALLEQEQRRKSRPTFDVPNMNVAEKLELATRRRSSVIGPKRTLSSTSLAISKITKMPVENEGAEPQEETLRLTDKAQSNASPTNKSPSSSPGRRQTPSPKHASPTHSLSPLSSGSQTWTNTKMVSPVMRGYQLAETGPSKPSHDAIPSKLCKESNFLLSLAVTDFLVYAEEELSTTVTALSVLLSMSEKATDDGSKLKGYRSSLEALNILDESECIELFGKTSGIETEDPGTASECQRSFEKLANAKKCLRQLLEKLEVHAPGSSVIRAFARSLRASELRDILPPCDDNKSDQPSITTSTPAASGKSDDRTHSNGVVAEEDLSDMDSEIIATLATGSGPSPTFRSKLFGSSSQPHLDDENADKVKSRLETSATTKDDGNQFEFLSTESSVFDVDSVDEPSRSPINSVDKPSDGGVATASNTVDADELWTSKSGNEHPAKTDLDEMNPFDDEALEEIPKATQQSHAELFDVTHDIQNDHDVCESHDDAPIKDQAPVDLADQFLTDDAGDDSWLAEEPIGDTTEFTEDGEAEAQEQIEETTEDQEYELEVEAAVETEGEISEWAAEGEGGEYDAEASGEAPAEAAEEEPWTEYTEETTDQRAQEYEEVAATDEGEYYEEYEQTEEQGVAEVEYQEGEYEEVGVEVATDVVAADVDDEEAEIFGDWEKGFDPNTNHYYWFNHATGESLWTPPEGWPYEVDQPFEEEAVTGGEEEEGEYYEDDQQVLEGTEEHLQQSRVASDFDDDVFSDNDLPM